MHAPRVDHVGVLLRGDGEPTARMKKPPFRGESDPRSGGSCFGASSTEAGGLDGESFNPLKNTSTQPPSSVPRGTASNQSQPSTTMWPVPYGMTATVVEEPVVYIETEPAGSDAVVIALVALLSGIDAGPPANGVPTEPAAFSVDAVLTLALTVEKPKTPFRSVVPLVDGALTTSVPPFETNDAIELLAAAVSAALRLDTSCSGITNACLPRSAASIAAEVMPVNVVTGSVHGRETSVSCMFRASCPYPGDARLE